jgi:hypothetical protein
MCCPYSSSQFLVGPITVQEVSIKDKGAKAQVVVAADGGTVAIITHRLLTTAARGGGFGSGSGAQHMFLQIGRFQKCQCTAHELPTFQCDEKI